MDMALFFWLPRAVLAYMAKRDALAYYVLYSRVRWYTSIGLAGLLFIGLMVLVFYNTIRNSWTSERYSTSLKAFGVCVVIFLFDFHFCSVIEWRTKKILKIAAQDAARRARE